MNAFKILFIAPIILILSSCMTTSAQQTYNSAEATLSNIGAEIKTCNNAVWNSAPELESILFVDKSSDPRKAKNNKAFIKNVDKKTMSQLMEKSKQCRERGYAKIQSHPDYYVRSFAAISQESIDLRHDVYKKYLNSEITGGAAASSLENIHQYLVTKWKGQQQQVASQLNEQHFQEKQAQAAMLQSIGAGFQDYSDQQQQYQNTYNQQQINKPVHTQCRWNAGVMDCTSYQY